MKQYELNNGIKIPEIGFGTWQLTKEQAYNAVAEALKTGYRLIDTAAAYRNEDMVGEAIRNSEVKRQDVFLTSKLWNDSQGYDNTLTAFDKSMGRLQMDYMDIYLIHWPMDPLYDQENWKNKIKETWKAMEKLVEDGSIRSIGVCNFMNLHMEYLLNICNIAPVLNQIEFHPGHPQKEMTELSKKHNFVIEAWSPLGSGSLINAEAIVKMAEKYHTDPASLCLNWCRQHNVVILPRTSKLERVASNFNLPDFVISEEDMNFLDQMEDVGYSGLDPMNLKY